jgi:hypothetical protein
MATVTRKKPPKYRSGLERSVANCLKAAGIEANHEKVTLFFTQPEKRRRYLVDFTFDSHPHLILEVKGRFTAQDRQKMLLVKEQHPDKHIIMLFGRAKNTLSKKSETTYADWCNKNDISFIDVNDFEREPACLLNMTKRKAGPSKTPRRKNSKT